MDIIKIAVIAMHHARYGNETGFVNMASEQILTLYNFVFRIWLLNSLREYGSWTGLEIIISVFWIWLLNRFCEYGSWTGLEISFLTHLDKLDVVPVQGLVGDKEVIGSWEPVPVSVQHPFVNAENKFLQLLIFEVLKIFLVWIGVFLSFVFFDSLPEEEYFDIWN